MPRRRLVVPPGTVVAPRPAAARSNNAWRLARAARAGSRRSLAGCRGAVLIGALVVALSLAGLVLALARATRVDALAAGNAVAAAQAHAIAEAATAALLRHGESLGYEALAVCGGWVWVLAQPDDARADASAPVYGFTGEAGRLDLNAAPAELLERLPGMTAELAAAIVDWRDVDDETSPWGAESNHYRSLDPPSAAKNAPFESVDELLLVRGFDLALLYGEDANRNGVLDAGEDDGDETYPPDNADGQLDPGIAPLLTVHSRAPVVRDAVDVNRGGAQAASDLQRALRAGGVGADRIPRIAAAITAGRPFDSLVRVYLASGMTASEFAGVQRRLTVGARPGTAGVDVNAAPRAVLAALPGLDDADAGALLDHRSVQQGDGGGDALASVAWVTEVLSREKALAIGPYITTGSWQHGADIVALAGDGRAFERVHVVWDTRADPPELLVWQRLTHLGWPLDATLRESVRAGLDPGTEAVGLVAGHARRDGSA